MLSFKKRLFVCALALIVFEFCSPSFAQEVKTASNPLVSYNTILFQWDYFNKLGSKDHYLTLNIQPSLPFHLNDKVDMIAYSDIPINSQMKMIYADAPAMNVGDIQQMFFFSKANTGNAYFGVGPVFSFPTATDPNLASGKWGIGPALQAAVFEEKKSYGIIGYYLFSYAGDPNKPSISRTYWNPWLTINLDQSNNVGIQTEPYYDFNNNIWQVPLEAYYNHFITINNQPIKLTFDGLYWPVAPSYIPKWSVRFNITLFYQKN